MASRGYEKFMGLILDSIADGVFTIDRDRRVTSFNKSAERITGFTRDQAIGMRCHDVFKASICQGGCALEKTIATGEPVIDMHINILNKQGRAVPISISTSALHDEKGQLVGGVETFRDLSAIEALKKEILHKYTFQDIVSKNHEILRILALLPDVAESGSTVLIQGPTGSGKELFARAIHNLSPRADAPCVAVNCGGLPDQLLESELFGYKKGAFTDARQDKPGRFALAEGGTIFLDEIGDISPAFQAKILRVLQEKEYEPLGGTATEKADVRIIAATNRNLADMVEQGDFRRDLYYRLNIVRLELPSLKRRREDIPLLAEHFIHSFNSRMQKNISALAPDALEALMRYGFPGNVRELQNIIEHAFVLCHGPVIERRHLPEEILDAPQEQAEHDTPDGDGSPLEIAEKTAIKSALARNNGHRGRTAEALGISPTTLWRKMKRFDIL